MLPSILCLVGCDRVDESRLPSSWAIPYNDQTIEQLIAQLGPPTEAIGAKQYINWIEPMPHGRRVLKVLCPDKCAQSERPSAVLYLIYRGDNARPTHAQALLNDAARR